MPRPTFTASEVARYVYCNLAWSYDVLGVPTLSAQDVQREKAVLLAKKVLTPEEQQDLAYLKSMEHSHARRDSGDKYHARVAHSASTFHQMTKLIFIAAFLFIALLVLLIFLLR